MAIDPRTKPANLDCESAASPLLSSASTVTIYYHSVAVALIFILYRPLEGRRLDRPQHYSKSAPGAMLRLTVAVMMMWDSNWDLRHRSQMFHILLDHCDGRIASRSFELSVWHLLSRTQEWKSIKAQNWRKGRQVTCKRTDQFLGSNGQRTRCSSLSVRVCHWGL